MTQAPSPFDGRRWQIDADTLGSGKSGQIEASPAECQAAAAALDLLDCAGLVLVYDLQPLSRRRFRLQARLSCQVTQASVVSLEPVPARIEEDVESELWPEGETPEGSGDAALDVLNAPVTETYEAGRIDLGQIAYELLSVSLDPYPKNEGEVLAEDLGAASQALSPFAALAQLRKG